MTKRQASKIDKCINSMDECINDSKFSNEEGWRNLIDDIDVRIEDLRDAIKQLRSARKVVEQSMEALKPFPWKEAEESMLLNKPLIIPRL